MKRYTYIIFCVVTLALMAACQKDELFDTLSTSDQEITFLSAVEATRATQTEIDDLESYGLFNMAAFVNSSKVNYFTDIVSYKGSYWASETTRYWPTSESLEFFAYSPYVNFAVINNPTDYDNYSLTYTCPADIDDQIDLLVKTLSEQKSTGSPVDLKFEHALSGIKFNVEFEDEVNITLTSISINYLGIENERSYDFAEAEWAESETKSYFDFSSGLSTAITLPSDQSNKTTTDAENNPIIFEIDNQLMIIPQQVSHTKDDMHYISIQISYQLIGAQDGAATSVNTGVMPLPAPGGTYSGEYVKGYTYTYNIIVNGEKMTFGDLSINDQDGSVDAYGNIDLSLITEASTIDGYEDSTLAYTTALRVRDLLEDGVRDFVVVGSMDANNTSDNTLGNGKLGYYGSTSSPFYIGAVLADLGSGTDDLFSVDLRGTYDYPKFADANNDTTTSDDDTTDGDDTTARVATRTGDDITTDDSTIGDDEPILIAGLFADIDWLDEVILPHGIAAIGNHAFMGCDALATIDIADVEHIEIGAFQDAKVLKTVENGALTRVHDHGFDDCIALETIDLEYVTQVDQYGFNECAQLTNVNLSSLKTIGIHAFSGCNNLTLQLNTSIPAFTSVADYAFNGCYILGNNGIRINLEGVTEVGHHAFADCKYIQLSSGSLAVLETVGEYAFSGCDALGYNQEFSIPSLVSVDMAGFADCPYVNIVSGLSNLTSISTYAFQNCTSFTGYSADASAENKVLSLPYVSKVNDYGLDNTAITNVAFSSDVLTEIGIYALSSCASLTTLTGLDKVTDIGAYAFNDCSSLVSLDLSSATSVGDHAISGCSALETIILTNYPGSEKVDTEYTDDDGYSQISTSADIGVGEGTALGGWSYFTSYYPKLEYVDFASVQELLGGSFVDHTAVQYIDLSSATTIGVQAFSGCTALETLILSSLDGSFGGWGTFSSTTSLKYVDLSSVTEVAEGTFTDHASVVAIDLRSATTIGAQAFQNCTALKKLNLSGLIDSDNIGNGAFWDFISGQCELWLPDDVVSALDGSLSWGGYTWAAIHKASDGGFTLIAEE